MNTQSLLTFLCDPYKVLQPSLVGWLEESQMADEAPPNYMLHPVSHTPTLQAEVEACLRVCLSELHQLFTLCFPRTCWLQGSPDGCPTNTKHPICRRLAVSMVNKLRILGDPSLLTRSRSSIFYMSDSWALHRCLLTVDQGVPPKPLQPRHWAELLFPRWEHECQIHKGNLRTYTTLKHEISICKNIQNYHYVSPCGFNDFHSTHIYPTCGVGKTFAVLWRYRFTQVSSHHQDFHVPTSTCAAIQMLISSTSNTY